MEDKTRKALKNFLSVSLIPLAISLPANKADAQIKDINNLNTLHFTIQPENLRLGVRNDYRIPLGQKKDFEPSKFGIYTSMSLGDYNFKDKKYIKDNLEMGIGGIFYPGKEPLKDFYDFISLGISYNYYNKELYLGECLDRRTFDPLAIELGVGARVNNFSGFLSLNTKLEYTIGVGLVYDWVNK